MIVTKYFWYRDRDFKKTESFIIKPRKYFVVFSARLVLCDKCFIQKYSSSCSPSSSFDWTTFLKIESDCNSFLPLLKIYSKFLDHGKKYSIL